jgi:hypothetical protein
MKYQFKEPYQKLGLHDSVMVIERTSSLIPQLGYIGFPIHVLLLSVEQLMKVQDMV